MAPALGANLPPLFIYSLAQGWEKHVGTCRVSSPRGKKREERDWFSWENTGKQPAVPTLGRERGTSQARELRTELNWVVLVFGVSGT